MFGYYFRSLRFLWKNTRQKFKAMDKYVLNGSKDSKGEYYE